MSYGWGVDPMRWAILVVVVLFVVFMIVKSRIPLFRDPELVDARRRIRDAKARARAEKGNPKARAAAYREAAEAVLEVGRTGLASSYARRADKADPEAVGGIALMARAMRAGERHRALEKLLWQRLANVELESPRGRRLFEELLALYEGPLRSRAQARVLRAMLGHQ